MADHGRPPCACCGAKLPPGRKGRYCKRCRANNRCTDRCPAARRPRVPPAVVDPPGEQDGSAQLAEKVLRAIASDPTAKDSVRVQAAQHLWRLTITGTGEQEGPEVAELARGIHEAIMEANREAVRVVDSPNVPLEGDDE